MSQPADRFTPLQPFPAQAMHACKVLARMLQRVPRPESVQLFTADHWSAPWLQVHLYPDPDDAQLAAYQRAFGGRLTRSRREDAARSVVYSELATEVDRVRVQVWNVNEEAIPAPDEVRPAGLTEADADAGTDAATDADAEADAGTDADAGRDADADTGAPAETLEPVDAP